MGKVVKYLNLKSPLYMLNKNTQKSHIALYYLLLFNDLKKFSMFIKNICFVKCALS